MTRKIARTGRAVAAVVAGTVIAGCHFAMAPPAAPHIASLARASSIPASAGGSSSLADPYGDRLVDARALLIQCAVNHAGLRPGAELDWFSNGRVSISETNAADFTTWWGTHSKPGPYPQAFDIDGHRTHYLEFGTSWVRKGSLWVPAVTAGPQALRYALPAWAAWAASHAALPPAVCGSSVSAPALQQQVFGGSALSPW